MKNHFHIKAAAVGASAVTLSLVLGCSILAWTEPGDDAPNGNVNAPLNTGSGTQTKAGALNISRGGAGECCSSGDFTLSLAEATSASGKKSGIQFHNSGVSEGQLRLDSGINGRELKAYSYQDNMDLHATGYVQSDQGFCISSDCRTTWGSISGPWTISGNNIYNNNSGNVGIGTANPGAKLDVTGGGQFSDALKSASWVGAGCEVGSWCEGAGGYAILYPSGYLSLNGYDIKSPVTTYGSMALTSAKNGYYGLLLGTTTANPNLMFDGSGNGGIYYENWGWLMYTLTSNHYLGIGTTNPAYKVDVNGTINSNNYIYGNELYTRDNVYLGYLGDWISNRLNQNVGSYANPQFGTIYTNNWFRSQGSTGWYSESYGGGWYMSDSSWIRTYNSKSVWTDTGLLGSNGGLTVGYGGSSSPGGGGIIAGNVGIGTASPAERLEVNGNVKLSGWARIYNGSSSLHIDAAGGMYLNYFTGSGVYFGNGASGVNASVSNAGAFSGTAFYYSSDENLKTNIRPVDDSIGKIQQLNGVYFDWKKDHKPSMGLIAQDVEKIFPEAVSTNKETGLKSVDYGKMIAPLIEAVKDQQKEISDLRSEIDKLKSKITNQD